MRTRCRREFQSSRVATMLPGQGSAKGAKWEPLGSSVFVTRNSCSHISRLCRLCGGCGYNERLADRMSHKHVLCTHSVVAMAGGCIVYCLLRSGFSLPSIQASPITRHQH